MLYYISFLDNIFGPLRLFKYVTFRAALAAAIAFMLVYFLGPKTIQLLKKFNTHAPSRHKGLIPDQYIDSLKDKTPSMGGILIVIGIVVSSILCAIPTNQYLYVFIFITVAMATVGFADDYTKAVHKKRDGIPGKIKLIMEFLIASIAVVYLMSLSGVDISSFYLPFMKSPAITGIVGTLITLPLAIFVVVGSSNAVNLTDGKDGLAAGCIIYAAMAFTVFAYLSGNKIFAEYLFIHYVPGAGEVGIFAASIIGASAGFLWYNCHPASVFMGDTGSLALGGSIGLIAVLLKQEIALIIVGGVFVIEALSVIIQVASFRLTGKRIFLCSPIHHHFERKGWKETQIVTRFWIMALIFALLGLSTLKLN
ncbi:MAG TPA: phospho-N-acetylmuramoyl-pentapeptide-transferase [Lentisphaeria bacterium]|nr:MAG: phospho-N-acetylmuramoyl-pentapeptide-transferase [Lentisphaerae bacterium GWF2_38_69]HBM15001.1 phospho-N-acetylmuramoyl-pentapeptide-transferase [Lentisphaeria bacterium]